MGETDKYSCKGLNKNINRDKINKGTYHGVLVTQVADGGVNKGFRVLGKDMVRYSVFKKAFSFEYIKRIVGPDGISTSPLDI